MNSGGYELDLLVVYGARNAVDRRLPCTKVGEVALSSSNKDWMVIGDFLKIYHPQERECSGDFDYQGADDFNTLVSISATSTPDPS